MSKILVYPVLLTLLIGAPAFADFQKGKEAYDSGDYATALNKWRPLAEQGNADAQYNLGFMYAKGQGVPQCYKVAIKWYRLAADQGYAAGQYNLGILYVQGRGVTQDYKAAIRWFKLAAVQGDASAQYSLGAVYANGHGVTQDFISAYMWWHIAALIGNEEAKRRRDIVEEQMTPEQIENALNLALECYEKNYKDC